MSLSYESHTSFYRVHPAPPPTVNSLTSHQKAQLRRSANKLTKVLGAAPQVLDDGYGAYHTQASLPSFMLIAIDDIAAIAFLISFSLGSTVHVSRPMPLTAAAKKKQPSLSVSIEPGKGKHRRTKSAEARVDPDLYPLSSSIRPAKPPLARKSAPAAPTSHYQLRRERSKSVTGADASASSSSEAGSAEALVNALSALHQRRMRPQSGASAPREVPTPAVSRPDSVATRDSLCDSLYEPTFVIPSSTKIRRDKMARVCKLLGEDVPIELVFPSPVPHDYNPSKPSKDDLGDDWSVIDIRRSSLVVPVGPPSYTDSEAEKLLPPLPTAAQPVLPAKPRLSVNTNTTSLQPQQLKWSSYRATGRTLEPIAELSPRSSCSSRASYASGASFSSSTTSSSYRFTSSGCSDPVVSPASASAANANAEDNAADDVAVASPTQDLHEGYGYNGRREFSIYLPFHRRARNSGGYAPVLGSDDSQEFEVVKTLVDLHI